MRFFFAALVTCIVLTLSAQPAHAIIFLPALILIPIAKIVAIVIGGLSIPALGISTLWSRLFRKSLKKTLLFTFLIVLIFAIILIVFLKILHPERPFF